MNEALLEFKKKNGKFPNKIIIYRDGVGNSQQKAVLNHELPQLQNAIKKVKEENKSDLQGED